MPGDAGPRCCRATPARDAEGHDERHHTERGQDERLPGPSRATGEGPNRPRPTGRRPRARCVGTLGASDSARWRGLPAHRWTPFPDFKMSTKLGPIRRNDLRKSGRRKWSPNTAGSGRPATSGHSSTCGRFDTGRTTHRAAGDAGCPPPHFEKLSPGSSGPSPMIRKVMWDGSFQVTRPTRAGPSARARVRMPEP